MKRWLKDHPAFWLLVGAGLYLVVTLAISCEKRVEWQYLRIPTAPDTVRDTVVVRDTIRVHDHDRDRVGRR